MQPKELTFKIKEGLRMESSTNHRGYPTSQQLAYGRETQLKIVSFKKEQCKCISNDDKKGK